MISRRIYVDIDDVLAATIENLIDLLEAMHARRVDMEAVEYFDLALSFGLDPEQKEAFMDRAHSDPVLESIAPIPGGADVLDRWSRSGHDIRLVTGRPPKAHAASRRWLERHEIPHGDLHHLDKWSRPSWNPTGLPALRFDELAEFDFGFAVEDNLETAVRLAEEFELPVALMDRPWNRDLSGASAKTRDRIHRCVNWQEVELLFARLA